MNDAIFFGPFRLQVAQRLLTKNGSPVEIGGRALDILILLITHPGKVISKTDLMAHVWPGITVEEVTLRSHINILRTSLRDGEDSARYIVNIPRRGYSFVGGAEIGRPIAERSPASSGAIRDDVPQLPSLLVGRKSTVDTLISATANKRIITIVGPGGIGKTTIAAAIAHQIRSSNRPQQVCFVDLSALHQPGDLVGAIILAVGCTVTGRDLTESLVSFLAGRELIIILDSCEHVIDAASQLASQIYRHSPGISILATSREPLRVEGEYIHYLSPLDSPAEDILTAAEALECSAVQLFMARAIAGGYRTELTDADSRLVQPTLPSP